VSEPKITKYERDGDGRCWATYTWLYDCPKKPAEGVFEKRTDEYGSSIRCEACGAYGGHQIMFGRKRVRAPEHDVELPPLPPLPGEQGRLL